MSKRMALPCYNFFVCAKFCIVSDVMLAYLESPEYDCLCPYCYHSLKASYEDRKKRDPVSDKDKLLTAIIVKLKKE